MKCAKNRMKRSSKLMLINRSKLHSHKFSINVIATKINENKEDPRDIYP